jgi:DNA repair protein RecO (recombination protein O)
MSMEKADALVIRLADFSETSRVVTLFTREFGKISALAKGARRLKGPFEAALDLLTACRIVFIRKSSGGLDLLTEAQLISRFRPNSRDLRSLYGGYYVAELLNALTEEYDPHPPLYDEAIQTLRRLADDDLPKLAILRFELIILREIGQLPDFEVCAVCGEAVSPDGAYVYWMSQGGLICRACQKPEFSQNRMQAGTVSVLKQLAAESDAVMKRLVVSDAQHEQMRKMMTTAITHALGRRPKMLRYLST